MSSSEFQNLPNFRDVSVSVSNGSTKTSLRAGILFRSARPDEATDADRKRLIEHYRIKTIIDLRSTTEHINATKKHKASANVVGSAVVPASEAQIARTLEIPDIKYAYINLNGKGFERSLVWQLKYFSLIKLAGLMLLGYRMEAISILGREVLQPRGLIGLGIDTLDHSGPEVREVFEVLVDEKSWPVMIHCTQGKDRTGIIIILILLLCGISIDAIKEDYIRSEVELEPESGERLKEISSIGLTEDFARCPPDFAQRIEEHINQKYGGLHSYLQQTGISMEKIDRLRLFLQEA